MKFYSVSYKTILRVLRKLVDFYALPILIIHQSFTGFSIKNAPPPPKSDCKHKMVLQNGLYCIVWLFKLFISKMLTSSNIFFESFYFRKSHFLIRCSNPEFTFLNTDIFSNTLLPIFPTFFSNFTYFIIKVKKGI